MRKKNLVDNLKKRLRKYLNYILVILSILLVLSLLRSITRTRGASDEISKAQERVSNLESKNKELKQRLEKVQSEEYVELQLRDKLGLAKEGEVVVVLPEDDIVRRFAPETDQEEESLPDPNWKEWLDLFF